MTVDCRKKATNCRLIAEDCRTRLCVQADLAPKHGARIFNTWVGEPSKMVLLEAMLDTVRKEQVGERGQGWGKGS